MNGILQLIELPKVRGSKEQSLPRHKDREESQLNYHGDDLHAHDSLTLDMPIADFGLTTANPVIIDSGNGGVGIDDPMKVVDLGLGSYQLHISDLEIGEPSNDGHTTTLDLGPACSDLPGPKLPEKVYIKTFRNARYIWFNVYRRLFSIVFILNMIGLAALLYHESDWRINPPLEYFATAASANIFVAILIRQYYFVNLCFKAAWIIPISAPLRLRRILAKVYEHGGVHSGAAVSSVIWFILLTIFTTQQFVVYSLRDPGLLVITFILLTLLCTVTITAFPTFRFKQHNTFEQVHRWGGWISLALFWAELLLFARFTATRKDISFVASFFFQPPFWFLLATSLQVVFPWFWLQKLHVRPEALGKHAVQLHFEMPIPCFVGLRLAETPLGEWHSFACIPSRDGGQSGGSVIVSDAGDWTRRTINNPKPFYWIKGKPVTGVLCVAKLFRKVVIVTTGSGIGPCLGVMQDIPKTSVRVIWSTPRPHQTYGANILESIRAVDNEAVIWDTKLLGRPNLVQMSWDLYSKTGAEAVFVISNPKLTKKLVYAMESRGVPAFGPIWDS